MKIDLGTRIGHLEFKNPVTVASGTFGVKDEYARLVDYRKLGAVITKTEADVACRSFGSIVGSSESVASSSQTSAGVYTT